MQSVGESVEVGSVVSITCKVQGFPTMKASVEVTNIDTTKSVVSAFPAFRETSQKEKVRPFFLSYYLVKDTSCIFKA